jgi:hypothetical protein
MREFRYRNIHVALTQEAPKTQDKSCGTRGELNKFKQRGASFEHKRLLHLIFTQLQSFPLEWMRGSTLKLCYTRINYEFTARILASLG